MQIFRSIRNLSVVSVLAVSANAVVIQNFDANVVNNITGPGTGVVNASYVTANGNNPCSNNTQMFPPLTFSVGSSASACHSSWATPSGGAANPTNNFLLVNGNSVGTVPQSVFTQNFAATTALGGTFSGNFAGLFISGATSLTLQVTKGATVLGSTSFNTNLAGGPSIPGTPAPWVNQGGTFTGVGTNIGDILTVEILLTNFGFGGNDFGVDTLDIGFNTVPGVPEPATFLLCGSALVAVAFIRRRK